MSILSATFYVSRIMWLFLIHLHVTQINSIFGFSVLWRVAAHNLGDGELEY